MPSPQTRTIALPPELERYIDDSLDAGSHADASALIGEALGLLRNRTARAANWLAAAGECADLVRAHDWANTALGPMEHWSPELRATVNNVLNSPIPKVLMWGGEHVMVYNDGYSAIAGARHPQALGGTVQGMWPEIWYFNQKVLENGFRGEVLSARDQVLTVNRNGTPEDVVFDLFYTPVYENGVVGGVMCTVLENTERAKAERALARSEAELRVITDALPVLISYIDRDHVYRFANSFYEDWIGKSRDEILGRHVRDVMGDKVYEIRRPLIERALAGEMVVSDADLPRGDGTPNRSEIHYIPRIEDDGSVQGFHVLVFDIEERVQREEDLARQVRHRQRAEDQLRHLNETLELRVLEEIAERRQVEANLAQAQKMETIGQLTGGVAHDFNNLLQVVSGNLQLLAKDVAGNDRAETRVANAMAGVSRGAKLAAQLLAFGRRQPLEPKVVNIARLVREMDDMLRRAIGEAIEVETIIGGGLWNCFIDPTQIENAILNLAINARDAMSGQGKLTIELGNASLDDDYARTHAEVMPGQYVMLAVSDTGCGMAPDIIEKVFEPFFSTKGEGKGSGLGLSMVYGFVKQSGGHVKIYSEVDEGTTIKIYMPRSMAGEDIEVDIDAGPVSGGTETILVVEDDDEVRATVVEMLGDLGYRVLKAVDAASALSVIESGIPIDMLFTDVVMPGTLKSPELARKARERLPDIAVLFTSGYTENSIVHGGRLDAGVELLSKPYTREALARKFRHVLANQRQRNMARASLEAPGHVSGDPLFSASQTVTVLLVEDDDLIRMSTAEMLQDHGAVVVEAGSAEDAMTALQTVPVDVLVTDVNLPGMSGPVFAATARTIRPELRIVFASGESALFDPEVADAILLPKPYDAAALIRAVGLSQAPAADAAVKDKAREE